MRDFSTATTTVIADKRDTIKPKIRTAESLHGDNLDGLKHLLKSYAGKIKCIYIEMIIPKLIQFNDYKKVAA